MKLSEAIVLGSTAVKPRPGSFASKNGEIGCALGMAWVAIGGGFGEGGAGEVVPRTGGEPVYEEWPILLKKVLLPCGCVTHAGWWNVYHLTSPRIELKDAVAHLFDQHVFGLKDWTLDQLACWVSSVEPSEAATQPGDGRAGTPSQVPTERDVTDQKYSGDCIDSLVSSVERAEKESA